MVSLLFSLKSDGYWRMPPLQGFPKGIPLASPKAPWAFPRVLPWASQRVPPWVPTGEHTAAVGEGMGRPPQGYSLGPPQEHSLGLRMGISLGFQRVKSPFPF